MTDLEALLLVSQHAPKLSPVESQFLRVIGRHETSYGRGWKDNSNIPGAVGDPRTSRNWGAITTLSEPFFTYMDGLPGKKEPRKFKVYPDDGFGIRDLSRHLYIKRPLVEPIGRGNAATALRIMSEPKTLYFEAPLVEYMKAAKRNYDEILRNTGESGLLSFDDMASGGFFELALVGGLLYAGYRYLT